MKKPRFNLKNKSEKETLISLIYHHNADKLVYSTGLKVPPRFWNDRSLRVKTNQEYRDHKFINTELDKIEAMAIAIVRDYISKNKSLSKANFKTEMDRLYHGKDESAPVQDFTSFIDLFTTERRKSASYAPASIAVYNTAKLHFKQFTKNKKINFEELTVDFFLDFIEYLYKKDFTNGHVKKIITTIRTMLNDATERGYNKNLDYKNRRIKVSNPDTDNIYLTEYDLNQLLSLDLSKNPKLERVRDLFIIGAYTGLRFNEFSAIQSQNIREIDGLKVIDTTIRKTKDRLIIPIHPIVEALFIKYNHQLPKAISNQKMNVYLKELCQMAHFNEMIIKREYRGGRMTELSIPKYKMVVSHTARRSFATNAYKADVPMLNIMRITGHKKPDTFLKYIKFNNEENAIIMAQHPFFKS